VPVPDSNALPGGSPDQTTSAQSHETLIAVSDLIGMDLPPGEVINVLFDSYLNSVHWFMMVFHEPTFRKELEGIITTGHVQQRRLSFLILVLVILANGAKYVSAEVIQSHCPGLNLVSLQLKLMAKIEEKFLDVFDEGDIESVQICVLLGSLYLYHGQPKRSFVVLGTALKGAHALGLHEEASWGRIDPIVREVRRRVWWALYVAEG
jgi:hypothetical protein